MTALIDRHPFPVHEPEALELTRLLASLYRGEGETRLFVESVGLDVLQVAVEGTKPLIRWYELLHQLSTHGLLRRAVELAREQHPKNPRASLLDRLLKDHPALPSAETIKRGDSDFDDSVTDREALLFFDDLTMPLGQVPNLIKTLQAMLAVAEAVCMLKVRNAFGQFFGTGFRIGPALILTNHHVLYPYNQAATEVHVDFGFDVDAAGRSLNATALTGLPKSIRGEADDDWAVIEVADMQDHWPILPIDAAPEPAVGQPAYILQHPGGQRKRLGFVRNTISDIEAGKLRYLTDTEPGSSGSPVFDADGQVIALHHAGGEPVSVLGKPPISKNQGIRISRVWERLQAAGLANALAAPVPDERKG